MKGASDFTTDEVLTAIAAALQDNKMQAVVDLLHVLAVKDPTAAEIIVAAIGRNN